MRVVAVHEKLQEGLDGTEQLVDRITEIIRDAAKRKSVRDLARNAAGHAPPQDATAEIQAIWDWLTSLTAPPYRMDPVDVQLFAEPETFQGLNGVDCKKYTIAGGALLEALGHPVKVRVIDQRPQDPTQPAAYHHVYLTVFNKDTGRWVPFDPVTRSFRQPDANVGSELKHRARRTYMIRPATPTRDGFVVLPGEQLQQLQGLGFFEEIGNFVYKNVVEPLGLDPTRESGVLARTLLPAPIVALADSSAAAKKALAAKTPAKPAATTSTMQITVAPKPPPAPGLTTTEKALIAGGVALGVATVVTLVVVLTRKPARRRRNPSKPPKSAKRRTQKKRAA